MSDMNPDSQAPSPTGPRGQVPWTDAVTPIPIAPADATTDEIALASQYLLAHATGDQVTKNVLIRTVTTYFTGHVDDITVDGWILLSEAAWIADTGRFSAALATGNLNEVEPYPAGVVWVNSGAVIEMSEWAHPLPRTVK